MGARARERLHGVADHARSALDGGLAVVGDRARTYAELGAAQIERARDRIPERLRQPSMTMVLAALGAGLLVGMMMGGKASSTLGELSEAGKDALRRRRLTSLR